MNHQQSIQRVLAHRVLTTLWREVMEYPAVRQVLSNELLYLLDDYAAQFGEEWQDETDNPLAGTTPAGEPDPRYPMG